MRIKNLVALFCLFAAGFYFFKSCQSETPVSERQDSRPTSQAQNQVDNEPTVASNNDADSTREPQAIPSNLVSSEEIFLKEFPGTWKFKRENGRLSYIAGGNIPGIANDADSVAAFAKRISPLLGVPANQISTDPIETSRSALSRVYSIDQWADGLPVYQASITFQARNADGAVFLINNQTREIGPYERTPKVTKEDAQKILEKKYFSEIEKIAFVNGPVLFSSPKRSTELAWVFNVTFKTPALQAYEIVVGAHTGDELHQQSLIVQ